MNIKTNAVILSFKNIAILIVVFVVALVAWKYYKKISNTEKLKVGGITLSPVKKLDNLESIIDVFKNGLNLKGYVTIRNFSSQEYKLSQLSLDCFSTKEEKQVAEQTNILTNDIILKKKAETNIPLQYTVDITNAISLFKESEAIPEDYTVWKIITHPFASVKEIDINKLRIILKGFIEAEGVTIKVNEIINLYE